MPVPFDGFSASDRLGSAAWLRFVEEEGGDGIRAALFETSGNGEPLGFCFTRVDRRDPFFMRSEDFAMSAVCAATKSLLQSAGTDPVLVFSLVDEAPMRSFTDSPSQGLPVCLVRCTGLDESQSVGPANGNPGQLTWAVEQPAERSDARRILDEIMDRDSPFEPFDRAGEALAEAFADEQVWGLATVPGLRTIVSLSRLPRRLEYSADSSTAAREAAQTDFEGGRPGLTLAERLWALLAARSQVPRNKQGVQLEWAGDLMPFQLDGVAALLKNEQLLLADDMGLGKTVQAVAAMRILRKRGSIRSCLVVTPASVLDQWRREIGKWAPELSAIIVRGAAPDRSWQWAADVDVTLVSYDTLRSDFDDAQSPVRMKTWDVVVADEAQRIKNRNTTSRALKGLRRIRSWALTGTPIENREEELASILEFVDHDGQSPPKRYHPGRDLQRRHRDLQLRRKKGDVLDDLPPKQETRLTIDLRPKQRRSYNKAEQDGIVYLKSLGHEVTVRHVLELITRLKQICNADPETGESSKLEDIKDRLDQLTVQGHKALVFSQYVSDASGVALAANRLREFKPLTLTGDMPHEDRAAMIDQFKNREDHKVMVLSLRAGGLGLNLQEASYVFHLDRWWNPAIERQAEDRSHRIGQTVKVNVIKYSCTSTIEERIDRILERKQRLFDELIDDVSLDLSTQMTREELFSLFDLKPPDRND